MRNISHTKTSSADGLVAVGKGLHKQIKDETGKSVPNPKYEAYHNNLVDLQEAYREYDGYAKPCCLELLSPLTLSDDDKGAIKELYSRDKKCIDDLWKEIAYEDGEYIMCPLCGQKTVTDLDHYVPRSIMPEFSVHYLNLIPTCHECNLDKDNDWLDDTGKRMIFNAYFDSLVDIGTMLSCSLTIGSLSDLPRITFQLDKAALASSGAIGRLIGSTYSNIENIRESWKKKASDTLKNQINEILRTINVHKRRGYYKDDNEAWDVQKEILQETIDSLRPFEFVEKAVYETMKSSSDFEKWLLSKIGAGNPFKDKIDYSLQLTCGNCDSVFDLDLDDYDLSWEIVDTDDRSMGAEIHHQAVVDVECPNCDDVITITLDVWEYSAGVFNTSNIEVEGAKIVGVPCSLNGLAPIGDEALGLFDVEE